MAGLLPNLTMTPTQYCRDKTRRARSSFYYPLFFLSPARRSAMYALYAFCREVDDIVDRGLHEEQARTKLNWWREELSTVFEGTPHHPVSIELARIRKTFNLPKQPFFAIIDGMEMDLNQQRYPNLAALTLYCQRVAVAVGEIAMGIFCYNRKGVSQNPERERQFAHHLGMAFQLTNILRDVVEDAQMGRIYLPINLLHMAKVTETDILNGRWSQGLEQVLSELAKTAETHYQHAESIPTSLKDRQVLMPALVMSGIYHAQLQRLREHNFNCFQPPAKLSTPAKLWAIWQTWRRMQQSSPFPSATPPPPPSP